jgi:hypothetical protein
VADNLGGNVINAVQKTASTARGLAGLGDTLSSPETAASTALAITGFIPGLGQISAALSTIPDIYRTVRAVRACY